MLIKLVIFSLLASANISLDFSLETKSEKIQKKLKTKLNKVERISIPNTQKVIQVSASTDIPANIPLEYQGESIKIDFKIFENGKLISSPEIVTLYGKEAALTMSEKAGEIPSISVKIKVSK